MTAARTPKSRLERYLANLKQLGETSDYEKDEIVLEMEAKHEPSREME